MDGVKSSASENLSMSKLVDDSGIDKNAITDHTTLSSNQSVSLLDQTELTSPHNPKSVAQKQAKEEEEKTC